ncbi:MAG: HAD-IIB family hydrolase [Clostridiales bacterium]|nr:HAD-IIB family hydrolase [Clostridiales bacterium]
MNANWAQGKIIFSDIDGTFLGIDSGRVERNYEAVASFIEAGGLFTFNSGRMHLEGVVPDFERIVNAPQILSNGALIQTVTGEILREEFLNNEIAEDIISMLGQSFSPNETGYECFMDKAGKRYYKVYFWAKPETVIQMHHMVQKKYQDRISYYYSCPSIIEFMKQGASKGHALQFVKHMYEQQGISLTAYAIGDFHNDIDMLKCADVACCPANASDEVKSICRQILCHHSEGAVADLIEQIKGGL